MFKHNVAHNQIVENNNEKTFVFEDLTIINKNGMKNKPKNSESNRSKRSGHVLTDGLTDYSKGL